MPEPLSCGNKTPGIGPIKAESEMAVEAKQESRGEASMTTARVGHPAPDFKAEAYYKGEFKAYQLSEFKGQWVVLCFYPGDFTFV